jgi:acyl-ACP thioesterase
MTQDNKYSDSFKIRGFHTGPDGKASIPSLCNFMNEAAGDHCVEGNITIEDLNKIGLTWMLSRLHISIEKLPVKGDSVTVTTWPTGARGLYSCRDFLLTSASGDVLLKAASAWLTINLEKRRVVRLPEIVTAIHPDPESAETVMDENFKEKLPEPESSAEEALFRADYSTLDLNRHVTSTVYIKWMFDSLPFDFMTSKKLKSLEVNYKLEILPGGEAASVSEIKTAGGGTEVIHGVKSVTDGVFNCLARSRWSDSDN